MWLLLYGKRLGLMSMLCELLVELFLLLLLALLLRDPKPSGCLLRSLLLSGECGVLVLCRLPPSIDVLDVLRRKENGVRI